MSSWKSLSRIDKRTKYKVYGWIRTAEQELRLNYIPAMITNICILYIGDDEIFHNIGNNAKLSKNMKCLTKTSINGWSKCNFFGYLEIPSKSETICQWDVKVIALNHTLNQLRIGVHVKKYGYHYAIDNRQFKFMRYKFFHDQHLPTFDVNDIVSVHLNLKDEYGKISFSVNGGNKHIAFGEIKRGENIAYRLIVSLHNVGDSVEIVNFIKHS